MNPAIELFVRNAYNYSKADLLLESFDVFLDTEIASLENDFTELLMLEGSIDRSELTLKFEQLVTENIQALILQHGVKVNEEATLSILNQIIIGLMSIQYYLDYEAVLRVVEEGVESEDQLSQILEMVTGIDKELLYPAFDVVSEALIEKIEELFEGKQVQTKQEILVEEEQFKVVRKVRDVARYINRPDLMGIRLINANVFISAPFENYLHYVHHELEDKTPEEVAYELFVLLNMSKDGYKNNISVFEQYSDLLFHNIDLVSRVKSQLIKIIQGFDSYVSQRSLNTPTQEVQLNV